MSALLRTLQCRWRGDQNHPQQPGPVQGVQAPNKDQLRVRALRTTLRSSLRTCTACQCRCTTSRITDARTHGGRTHSETQEGAAGLPSRHTGAPSYLARTVLTVCTPLEESTAARYAPRVPSAALHDDLRVHRWERRRGRLGTYRHSATDNPVYVWKGRRWATFTAQWHAFMPGEDRPHGLHPARKVNSNQVRTQSAGGSLARRPPSPPVGCLTG